MTSRVSLPVNWWVPVGIAAVGMMIGGLAGVKPEVAIFAALGIVFVGVTLASLHAGLCLFAVLSFVDTVLPYGTSGVSLPKVMGALLIISWLANITTRSEGRREVFLSSGFLYLVVVFIAWVVLSITWAEESGPVIDSVIRYVPNAMLFLITYQAVRTRNQALWLIGAFVVGTLISAAYGFAVPTDPDAVDRLSGAGGNANETAAALAAGSALAAALALALREPVLRIAAAVVVPLSVLALFLTLSRGGLVAFVAVLVSAVLMAGRRRALALSVVAVLVALSVSYFAFVAPTASRDRITEANQGTGREDIWRVGWRMVKAEPLRGVGAGNFQISSVHYLLEPGAIRRSDFIVDTPKVAHNTYLGVLAELGIVGLALFLAIFGYALACGFKAVGQFKRNGDLPMEIVARALLAALIGLLTAAFFGSREFDKQLWLLLSICPALLALARGGSDDPSGEPQDRDISSSTRETHWSATTSGEWVPRTNSLA